MEFKNLRKNAYLKYIYFSKKNILMKNVSLNFYRHQENPFFRQWDILARQRLWPFFSPWSNNQQNLVKNSNLKKNAYSKCFSFFVWHTNIKVITQQSSIASQPLKFLHIRRFYYVIIFINMTSLNVIKIMTSSSLIIMPNACKILSENIM